MKSGAGFQKDHREKIELVRACDEDGEHILRKVLRVDIPGKRKRGRPKTRWKDACQRDWKSSGLRSGEDTDRAMWRRKIIDQLYRRTYMMGKASSEKKKKKRVIVNNNYELRAYT